MAFSKLVLFVVEGESDELALGRSLTTVFAARRHLEVRFGIVRGDITADSDGSPSDIKKRVNACARQYLSRYKLKWSDLDSIVLISDMDGAFLNSSSVVERQGSDGIIYLPDRIICNDAYGINKRNERKSGCLKVLSRTGYLSYSGKKVRFIACYMSRNLEHALSDRIEETSTDDKFALARRFTKRYGTNDVEFLAFLKSIAPEGDYRDSWDYISQGTNSLQRGSNLCQVLKLLTA